MIDADPGYSPELHARLATELGLAGLTVPKEFGGRGLSQADAGVVHAELGHALYPGPFLPSGLAAGVLLAATGDAAAQGPMTADGAAAAKRGSAPGRRVGDRDDRGRRPGRPLVAGTGGVRAHLTRTAGGCTAPGGTSSRRTWRASWRCRPGPGPCPRCSWWRRASGVQGRRAARPGPDPAGLRHHLRRDPGRAARPGRPGRRRPGAGRADFLLATAAEAVGGIGWCLDTAVLYAKDREQSGRPTGSFRAVAHACVEMLESLLEANAVAGTPPSPPRPATPRPRPRRGWPRCAPGRPIAR